MKKARKPIRRRREGPRARLEARLTVLAALVVKWRDKWKCQRCRRSLRFCEAEAAHVVAKSQGSVLRWDPENLLTLCTPCHRWGHANPAAFREWFMVRFPARSEYIESCRHKVCKRDETRLRELEGLLEQELLRVGGDPWSIK